MQDLYIYIIVVFSVVSVGTLYIYGKSKGFIKSNLSVDITDALSLFRLITEVVPLGTVVKDKATAIFDIADFVAGYIHDLGNSIEDIDKISMDTVLLLLAELNISPTESEKKLIKITLDTSFEWLKKNV
ncbi:hypothetical protein BSK59_22410 [Paenibacillus odorifer]|uniref:hypothetical protein n=1 Tax=Paenibacillus odorifer TaxID=189426 RepID=UPI00096BFBAE|nr:hypothetical protein [Paenibacillus odorifer]OME50659.1 hypothetical protein BSK59_22410 [Paenibacillus odorifer]